RLACMALQSVLAPRTRIQPWWEMAPPARSAIRPAGLDRPLQQRPVEVPPAPHREQEREQARVGQLLGGLQHQAANPALAQLGPDAPGGALVAAPGQADQRLAPGDVVRVLDA